MPPKVFTISDPSAFRTYVSPTLKQEKDTTQGTDMRPSEAANALPIYLSSYTDNRYCIPPSDELAAVPQRINNTLQSETRIEYQASPNKWTWTGVACSDTAWIHFEVSIYNEAQTYYVDTTAMQSIGGISAGAIHEWLVVNIEALATNPQAPVTKLNLCHSRPPMHRPPLPEQTIQAYMTTTIGEESSPNNSETKTIGEESSPNNDDTTRIGAIQKMIADTHPTAERLDHRQLILFIFKNISEYNMEDRDEDPYIYFSLRFLAIISGSAHYSPDIHTEISKNITSSKMSLFIAQDPDYRNAAAIKEAKQILESYSPPNC